MSTDMDASTSVLTSGEPMQDQDEDSPASQPSENCVDDQSVAEETMSVALLELKRQVARAFCSAAPKPRQKVCFVFL